MKKWYALLRKENMDNAVTAMVCEMLSKTYGDEQCAEKMLKKILANDEIYNEIQNSVCDVICTLVENDFI